MDLAKRQAAEVGYEIYRSSPARPTLIAINAALHSRGLVGVKDRTYKHYRRLDLHDQSSYVPINEFDIALKHRQAQAVRWARAPEARVAL